MGTMQKSKSLRILTPTSEEIRNSRDRVREATRIAKELNSPLSANTPADVRRAIAESKVENCH